MSVEPPPVSTHPYAVRISLLLGNNVELDAAEDDVRLPFSQDAVLRIAKEARNPREEALSLTRVTVDLEAFSTAADAEQAGKLLVLSLLWMSASEKVTIAFRTRTGAFPFAVRDRTRGGGISAEAEGRVDFN